tara:strand:- start:2050 stop:2250 length:201 start_codon:yes stop_codon:yes gene_type:complete
MRRSRLPDKKGSGTRFEKKQWQRERLQEDVDAFLEAGGQIEVIPTDYRELDEAGFRRVNLSIKRDN